MEKITEFANKVGKNVGKKVGKKITPSTEKQTSAFDSYLPKRKLSRKHVAIIAGAVTVVAVVGIVSIGPGAIGIAAIVGYCCK